MAKSKGSQGNFSKPKLASSAGLFEKRGDKWGGGSRPQPLPHNPSETEQAIDTALKSIAGPSYGQSKIGPTGQQSRQYAAEIAARLRQANAEDPDADRWTKAKAAEEKADYVNPATAKIAVSAVKSGKVTLEEKTVPLGVPNEITTQRRIANAMSKYRGKIGKHVGKVKDNRGLKDIPTTEFDQAMLIEKGKASEARVRILAEKEGSREKARQLLEKERQAEIARRADYMARKLGKK